MKRFACLLFVLALLVCLLPLAAVAQGEHTPLPAACAFLYEGGEGTIDYTNDRDVAVHLSFLYPDTLRSEAGDELAVACGPENIWFLEPGESLRIELRFGGEGEAPAPGTYRGEILWAENDEETNAPLDEGTIALTVVVSEEQETNPVSVTVLGDPGRISYTLWASREWIEDGSDQSYADQGAIRIAGGEAPVGWFVGLEATSKGAQGVDGKTSYIEEQGEPFGIGGSRDFSGQASVRFASGGRTGKGPVTFTLVLDPVWLTLQPNGAPGYAKYSMLPGNWPGTVPENPFTYSGHVFLGWNTRADGSGTPYAPGDTVTLTEGLTLYAQWGEPPGGGQVDFAITVQPGNVTVRSGHTARFAVKAKGKALTYQWFSRAGEEEPWTAVEGATGSSLSLAATRETANRQYCCRVKNGSGEVYSSAATLLVKLSPPVLRTQPKDAAGKSGEKVRFSVKAEGKHLAYQWFARPDDQGAWAPLAGEIRASLSLAATMDKDGWQFRCEVKNEDGAITSNAATLTVTPHLPRFTTQPRDARVKPGAIAKFKAVASRKDVTYQWYCRASENAAWEPLDGETGTTLQIAATEETFGWQFRCRAQNAEGETWSRTVTLKRK